MLAVLACPGCVQGKHNTNRVILQHMQLSSCPPEQQKWRQQQQRTAAAGSIKCMHQAINTEELLLSNIVASKQFDEHNATHQEQAR